MKKSELKFLNRSMMYVPNNGIVVEIGSWMGGSSEQLVKGILKYLVYKVAFYCIDPFDEEYFKKTPGLQKKLKKYPVNVLEAFQERMKPYEEDYILLRDYSENAVNIFRYDTIDFLFIDGNHDYEFIKKDIDLYWPKIKAGGVMCGHDYGKYGVKKAVDERFKTFTRFPAHSIWMVVK